MFVDRERKWPLKTFNPYRVGRRWQTGYYKHSTPTALVHTVEACVVRTQFEWNLNQDVDGPAHGR